MRCALVQVDRVMLLKDGAYTLENDDQPRKTPEQLVEFWASWVRQYPIVSLEDGLAEKFAETGAGALVTVMEWLTLLV